jgi:hypothetical protein
MRYVIVHYHIFKNGGSTIESILGREFPGAFATLHGPSAQSVLDGRDLIQFLRQNPEISAVSSHHLRYPKPEARGIVLFDCCFLRHPLLRLQSLYRYYRAIDSTDPLCRLARQTDARQFMKRLLDNLPHLAGDVQVTALANAGAFTRPATERDLDRALAILDSMAIPGLVEMFDQSLVAAEYFLKPAFPNLRLECVPQNVTRQGSIQPNGNEQELISIWGADIYDHLVRINRLDLELFRRAELEIKRRMSLLRTPEEKLAAYRTRCANLRAAAAAM